MKISRFFKGGIQADVKSEYLNGEEFRNDLIRKNVYRGKILAIVTTAIETVFLLVDLTALFFKASNTFSFYSYLFMYFLMIVFNLVFLIFIKLFNIGKASLKLMSVVIVIYITLATLWGSMISLMDQRLYGDLMAFMVNMIVCSVIYLLSTKTMLIPYIVSVSVLAAGLPLFQSSGNVLVGHYVNLFVFVVISWIASRLLYRSYCDNYIGEKLIKQSRSLLEKKIDENRRINQKLAIANAQLKKLALVDELTELPNRRSFREFIDGMFETESSLKLNVSVIMVDIDLFKQYNDFFGHEAGDNALIAIAKQLDTEVYSPEHIAVRWGGEEFIYAAVNKSREDMFEIAETLRQKVQNLRIPNPSSSIDPFVTISLGVCFGTAVSKKNIGGIIRTADKAMYIAKNNGRNCVASLPYNECFDTED